MKIGVKLGLEIQNLYSKRLWMPSEWVRNEKKRKYYHSFQKTGLNRISTLNSSRRPMSIRKDMIH